MDSRAVTGSILWLGLAAGLSIVGCDDSLEEDCIDLCNQTNGCSEPTVNLGTCEEQCARIDDLAGDSDCEDQMSDFVSCALDAADPCQLETSCTAEMMGYFLCVEPFCEAEPPPESCRGFTCSYSRGGSGETCSVSAECTGSPQFEIDCVQGACTCIQDGAEIGTVAFQATFCDADLDGAVAAAQIACEWSF